ncbi:nuclear transport factor 2 family protein [Pseudomonas grimontii]|uniref:nuclear transport factor 2 family protein n=1 Tax=Pseudomonas grimontii TaxID=129847 RepID=UPI0028F0CE90|nr:nuclear transport factor 2 family protein [Pseudomonas grimontii]
MTTHVSAAQGSSQAPHFIPSQNERLMAFAELHELLSEYWARVDRLSPLPVANLYTPSGEMQIGALQKSGQAEIASFFSQRNQTELQKQRSTRHVLSNVRIEWVNASRVIVLSLVVAYAAIGEFPHAAATAPATIADFTDICTRDNTGAWKIESKKARILLTGEGAANFVR